MDDLHSNNIIFTLATPGGAAPVLTDGGPTTTSEGAPLGNGTPQQQAPPPTFAPQLMLIMIAVFGGLIFVNILAGRKQRKQRQELLGSLAKQDRVRTTSGMIGTIVEIKGDEVVIKVDESTNTKIRFVRSAVDQVLAKRGVASNEPGDLEEIEDDKAY